MKKKRLFILALLCILCVGVLGMKPSMESKAAAKFNLIKNVSKKYTPYGKWVKNKKGYRYRYVHNRKYVKGVWRKINGKIYYFNKKGYRVTGTKKFKGNLYFLNKRGVLTTGWVNTKGKRYYFSAKTGAAMKGWHTIDKQTYYFNKSGVMLRNQWVGVYYVGPDGYMLRNTKVGEYYVGPDGKRIENPTVPSEESTVIFVGDSRFVGMQEATLSSDVYIAKVGEGYPWLTGSALKALEEELALYPKSKVIFNFGINDLGSNGLENANNYITLYASLTVRYPDTRFYFLSVNPIERNLAKKKKYDITIVNNNNIKRFNAAIKAAFPTAYLDSYSYLVDGGYIDINGKSTGDGIHYNYEVSRLIYNFVLSKIKG